MLTITKDMKGNPKTRKANARKIASLITKEPMLLRDISDALAIENGVCPTVVEAFKEIQRHIKLDDRF